MIVQVGEQGLHRRPGLYPHPVVGDHGDIGEPVPQVQQDDLLGLLLVVGNRPRCPGVLMPLTLTR